uniref:Fibronectin type-III domain-containing protein n=1 Tax=Calidris pygmaea TaxID=425635 RepID=A0A8C3JAV2_9CHAR
MWKPLNSFPPSGRILGYKIQYFPENNAALKMTNSSTDKKIILLLNEEAYIISITAYNSAGNSPEAILRIPSTDEKGDFKPFICYNISVYPLYGTKVAAPYSIQTYVQEKKPSAGPVADTGIPGKNEVTIKWKEISKDKRNGFITNYTIFYKPEDGKELNETVNSDVLQYRLKFLQANTQYTVYIMASNGAGGTSGEPKTFKTLKFDKEDVIFIALPVGLSMLFLLGLWITCILNKHAFKNVCWPDIPNPAESMAVEWPLHASVNNSFLKGVTSEAKTIDFEDLSVLEHCFPEESQEGSLLMNCENHVSECRDINTNGMINRDTEMLYNEEAEDSKCFSPCMSYIITDQDIRSQMHSALIPAKEIQPTEVLEEDLCESQQTSIKNEENDHDEVLKLEDFSEKALFNPYLKNSVKTREFLISENLLERNKNESKSQSNVLPPCQQNATGQSYITLDMFGLSTAH